MNQKRNLADLCGKESFFFLMYFVSLAQSSSHIQYECVVAAECVQASKNIQPLVWQRLTKSSN